MEFLNWAFTPEQLFDMESWIGDWFFILALGLFFLELVCYSVRKQISWNLLGDSATNFVTLAAYIGITSTVIAGFYLGVFMYVYEHFSLTHLPMTCWSILACLLLADLAYYWEHRFLHSCGIGWATHTVHHSSPNFNISVAYRFGPLDGLFPLFFYLPLAFLGFHPLMIFLCEMLVQIYQTLLHTEVVKKLPKPIEAVLNTPSHHRVHHATNTEYLDKNYAGILIIWDRMFGTFAEEQETVRYGVYPRLNSLNPVKVFFHGFLKLARQIYSAPNWSYRWRLLANSPKWAWDQEQKLQAADS
ncbi:hypothetical protein BTA51_14135 [Hahella sp. CCB-MM4]|uniref:sterol desaturase family protein n=1 Tax=Hahella sp. (strain CCB-MM4) TaxID=1926491 RepID=UPI000B9C4928|nr:sterol desaturase family protein [Hahella sp. CCB-MM4]OZG72664.1 hypothetical protein BTA51_14135 [Hahella sp. CCB-MM4]